MKRLLILMLLAVECVTESAVRAGEPAKIIGVEPQLFLDDWIVAESTGLKRNLHQPTKKGLIKEAGGRDWQRGSVYASIDSSNAVVRDQDGLFHMTYRYMWWDSGVRDLHPSIGNDKAHWFRVSTAYATSKDGLHWHKPRLGRIDGPTGFTKQAEFPFETPSGLSKDNNLGCPLIYVRDLQLHGNITDPDKRFLVRLGRPRDTHNFATIDWQPLSFAAGLPDILGKSPDAAKLTPIAGGQLPPRGLLAGYDAHAKVWFSVGQDRFGTWRGRNGRDIARCTSPDLVKWEGPNLVLPVAEDEAKDAQDWVEYMDLVAYRVGGPQTGAWLGQLVIFRGDRSNPQYLMPGTDNVWRKGTTELRLVVSRDAGRTWQRVGGKQVWLPCSSEPHGFDRLVFAANPVDVGDELWFYYPAWDGDHLVFNRDGSLHEPGFLRMARTARATLRRDGYLSLDAGAEPGSLLTKPLVFKGDQLVVNLQAPKGRLRVELADEAGKPIPDFTLADSVPVKGDGVNLPVQWKGGKDLKGLAGKSVCVRFQLSNGSLYAFRFGRGPEPAPKVASAIGKKVEALIAMMIDEKASWEDRCAAEDALAKLKPEDVLPRLLKHAGKEMPSGGIVNSISRDADKRAPVPWQIHYAVSRTWYEQAGRLSFEAGGEVLVTLLAMASNDREKARVLQELQHRWSPRAEEPVAKVMLDPAVAMHPRVSAAWALVQYGKQDRQNEMLKAFDLAPHEEKANWFEVLTSQRNKKRTGIDPRVVRGGFQMLLHDEQLYRKEVAKRSDAHHTGYFASNWMADYLGEKFQPNADDPRYNNTGRRDPRWFADTVANALKWWEQNRGKFKVDRE